MRRDAGSVKPGCEGFPAPPVIEGTHVHGATRTCRRLVTSPTAVRVHIAPVVRMLDVPDRVAAVELSAGARTP